MEAAGGDLLCGRWPHGVSRTLGVQPPGGGGDLRCGLPRRILGRLVGGPGGKNPTIQAPRLEPALCVSGCARSAAGSPPAATPHGSHETRKTWPPVWWSGLSSGGGGSRTLRTNGGTQAGKWMQGNTLESTGAQDCNPKLLPHVSALPLSSSPLPFSSVPKEESLRPSRGDSSFPTCTGDLHSPVGSPSFLRRNGPGAPASRAGEGGSSIPFDLAGPLFPPRPRPWLTRAGPSQRPSLRFSIPRAAQSRHRPSWSPLGAEVRGRHRLA